jgi:eukaryotic-like serine/threonine-protein kinase
MQLKLPFQDNKIGSLLATVAIVGGSLFFLLILYFYVYLPNVTNHGNHIEVPDFTGIDQHELQKVAEQHKLRFAIDDSAYSADYPPYTAIRQFPKAGAKVKEKRLVYITINRITAPTMPIPDLVDRSLINAEVVLKSNELVRGNIVYQSNPFRIIMEMRYKGKEIKAGTRVPKGSRIDLVLGDGNGASDLVIGTLIGDTYDQAVFKLAGWNLHLGRIEIAPGIDTTGMKTFVYKQEPKEGDSVRVGDPINLWIGPKNYTENPIEEEEN